MAVLIKPYNEADLHTIHNVCPRGMGKKMKSPCLWCPWTVASLNYKVINGYEKP